jgi:hypothetical protein
MPGWVNIGGILLPESSKPRGDFLCRLCSNRFETPDQMERHVAKCARRHEEQIANSPKSRLSEFYLGHDLEREAWLKSPAGKAWWERAMAKAEREF